jgi:lauroyl/myristoyl acyltransferase
MGSAVRSRGQASWLKVWRGGECKLRVLGKPRPNAVKFFSSIELITLLADPNWLDEATKTIGQFWRRKNARRKDLETALAVADGEMSKLQIRKISQAARNGVC